MKRIVSIVLLIIAPLCLLKAQEAPTTAVDSIIFRLAPACDSSLVGQSVISLMPAGVNVSQSQAIASALESRIASQVPGVDGYRVRIYFANNQNSRTESEAAAKSFMNDYPGIMAYRNYQNPFFKVTVGDFRTKSEAMSLLSRIKGRYPAAFIVKERINYPPLERENEVLRDTLKVSR